MLDAFWKFDNPSWHRTGALHSSWEEISDIKLDDFSHIPLHAKCGVRICARANSATTVDSALPNSSHLLSRQVPAAKMALARLDLMRILCEADGSSAGPLRAFDDVASLCRCRTTIRELTRGARVFGLLCRSRSSGCLLRCGCRCYALVVPFDPLLFDNPWATDLFPTVSAIREQSCVAFMSRVPVDQTCSSLGERTKPHVPIFQSR